MASPVLLILKAHNKGYSRKDGTHVGPFDDKRASAQPKPPASPSKWSAMGSKPVGLFGDVSHSDHAKDLGQAPGQPGGLSSSSGSLFGHKPLAVPKDAIAHPKAGEKGKKIMIYYPSKPSDPETWTHADKVATFVPGGAVPAELNGVPLSAWADAPTTQDEWDYVDGQNDDLEEPGLELPKGKIPASGVVVLEPDGRVWVIAPTNRFSNTKATFPKGGREFGLSLQANAIKECFEESGLKVEIDSFLGDVERSTSVARYYLARRVGGTPADMGWESQAVHLVPAADLVGFMDRGDDKKVAAWLDGLV